MVSGDSGAVGASVSTFVAALKLTGALITVAPTRSVALAAVTKVGFNGSLNVAVMDGVRPTNVAADEPGVRAVTVGAVTSGPAVPVNVTVLAAPGALLLIVNVAVFAPTVVCGAKVTEMVQVGRRCAPCRRSRSR